MKKYVAFMSLFVAAFVLRAQQVPLFSQYSFNPFIYNPAYAGAENRFVATTSYRNQWVGFTGAPKTALFSFQGALKGGSAIGSTIFSDVIGSSEMYGINLAYAYRVKLDHDLFLSFGLQWGFKQFTLNGETMITHDADDAAVPLTKSNSVLGDASFGVYLHNEFFFVGAAIPQLLNGSLVLNDDMGTIHKNLIQRHFLLNGGLKLKVSENTQFEPSILMKTVVGAPIQLDFNAKLLFSEKYWFGLSYRTRAAFCLLVGLQISDHFLLGYSYDYSLNDLGASAANSHEILLGWKFNEKKRSKTFY